MQKYSNDYKGPNECIVNNITYFLNFMDKTEIMKILNEGRTTNMLDAIDLLVNTKMRDSSVKLRALMRMSPLLKLKNVKANCTMKLLLKKLRT